MDELHMILIYESRAETPSTRERSNHTTPRMIKGFSIFTPPPPPPKHPTPQIPHASVRVL